MSHPITSENNGDDARRPACSVIGYPAYIGEGPLGHTDERRIAPLCSPIGGRTRRQLPGLFRTIQVRTWDPSLCPMVPRSLICPRAPTPRPPRESRGSLTTAVP